MRLVPGDVLLGGRYEVLQPLDSFSDEGSLWTANDTDEYVKPYLMKTLALFGGWAGSGERALWDTELRSLYQVRSTPGSERSLLQLHNVGIDLEHHCFVMVFEADGYRTLASLLADRPDCAWLSGRGSDRQSIWKMLDRLASVLDLLHRPTCRAPLRVAGDGVWTRRRVQGRHGSVGSSGVFDWGVRQRSHAPGEAGRHRRSGFPVARPSVPTRIGSPSACWWRGACWTSSTSGSTADPVERFRLVRDQLGRGVGGVRRKREIQPARGGKLTPLEQEVIGRLIAEEPTERLRRGDEVQALIREVIDSLEEPLESTDANQRHFVVVNAKNQRLIDALEAQGLRAALGLQPGDAFSSMDRDHVTKLIGFLYDDFSDGGVLSPGLTVGTRCFRAGLCT